MLMSMVFEEHDYIGLSEVSSTEQTSDKAKDSTKILNFKATELRLGLPGSQSPERAAHIVDVEDKNGNDFNSHIGKINNFVSGAKRGFSDAINGASNNWVLSENGGSQSNSLKSDDEDVKKLQNSPVSVQGTSALASSKAQVVGWPPIRSFRKNSMAVNTPKTNENKDSKPDSGCHYVKVSMDGAPYLRKINLGSYASYVELLAALEKMFSGFKAGQVDFSKGRLMDNLCHSEYVLTYEDKDGDWMLVGDVPWNMFMDYCRRLRIMKSSDAVGLASRATGE
ncbi:Auxin-responsive protein IAA27 [Bienertia sinuspersici]